MGFLKANELWGSWKQSIFLSSYRYTDLLWLDEVWFDLIKKLSQAWKCTWNISVLTFPWASAASSSIQIVNFVPKGKLWVPCFDTPYKKQHFLWDYSAYGVCLIVPEVANEYLENHYLRNMDSFFQIPIPCKKATIVQSGLSKILFHDLDFLHQPSVWNYMNSNLDMQSAMSNDLVHNSAYFQNQDMFQDACCSRRWSFCQCKMIQLCMILYLVFSLNLIPCDIPDKNKHRGISWKCCRTE